MYHASNVAEIGRSRFPDGCVEWIRPYLGWFVSVFIMTSLLCGILNWDWQSDFDLDDRNNDPNVSVSASPGFLSISTEIIDNSNVVKVVSSSTVPVDTVAKAEDGHDLSTYYGLEPGGSFYFRAEESCTITATAC